MFYTSPGFSGFMTDHPGTGPLDAGGADPRNAILRQADSNRPNQAQPGALAELMGINRDFVGWVSIEGTGVSYPVVRGGDNSYYLNTTFTGSSNPAGSIFMDYRLERGFNAPVCILYGHNMRDGSMFAQLNQYLDSAFMEEHQDIRIITPEGHYLVYRVFDARSTDMWDTAYDVDLMEDSYAAASNGASGGAGRFLLLSTCTPGADRSGRMLVYAALVQH
jgi:sortase B